MHVRVHVLVADMLVGYIRDCVCVHVCIWVCY